MGNKKAKLSSGPAKGLWICRPTEDGIGIKLVAIKSLRFVSWATLVLSVGVILLVAATQSNLQDVLPEMEFPVLWFVVSSLMLVLSGYSLFNTRRSLRIREAEDDPKKVDKTGERKGFYVAIDFRDGTIRTTNMLSRTKWSSVRNAGYQLESEQTDVLDDGEVEVMQSVLPRLSELLRVIGSDSSIQLADEGNGVWRFTFHRGPGSLFFLRSAFIFLILSAPIFLAAFVVVLPHELGTSAVFLTGLIAALLLAFESHHRLGLPPKLSLTFKPRTQSEEENRYDMRWSVYHGIFLKMHDEWAVLTHANCVNRFCNLLNKFKDEEESTGFDDLDIKRFADGDRGIAGNRDLSVTSKSDRVRFSLYPIS